MVADKNKQAQTPLKINRIMKKSISDSNITAD